MKIIPKLKSHFLLILLCALGGFIGGFFGSGGGVVFVYVFKKHFGNVKEIFPTVIVLTLFSSAVNSVFYSHGKNLPDFPPLIIVSGIAGAIFGCLFFKKLKMKFLKTSFAILSIISGIILII